MRVESCCFPRELVSFDPRHVTRFPPIGKMFVQNKQVHHGGTFLLELDASLNESSRAAGTSGNILK